MPEEKFDPVKEFTNLRDSLSRAVEQGVRGVAGSTNAPAVDVYETPYSVIVRTAPIDGIIASSLEVTMENGVLTLSGETQPDSDAPAETAYIARERRFGPFTRSIRIPREVKSQEARARLKHGSLTITLPKVEDKRPQVIDITTAE